MKRLLIFSFVLIVFGFTNAVAQSITVSTTSLAAFSTTQFSPSSIQSFTVSATGLTAPLILSAPFGFEFQESTGNEYRAYLAISPVSGSVSQRTIQVRLVGNNSGSFSGSLSISSTGATTRTVSVSGTVAAGNPPSANVVSGAWTRSTSPLGFVVISLFRTNSGTILCGGPQNIFRSANDGASWTIVNSRNAQSMVETTTGIYAVSSGWGGGGVFRSVDDGRNWVQTATGEPFSFAGVNSIAEYQGFLYAGAGNGLYRSNNNGVTWTAFSLGVSNLDIQSLAVNSSSNILYAATRNGRVFSINGTTVSEISSGIPSGSLVAINSLNANVLGNVYLGTENNGLYRLSGNSWSKVTVGSPDSQSANRVIAVGSTLFCSTYGGIYASTNGGSTWTVQNTGFTNAFYSRDIVSNAAQNSLICGPQTVPHRSSTTLPLSWTAVPGNVAAAENAGVAQIGSNLVSYSTIGIHTSSNNGNTWTFRNNISFNSIANIGTTFYGGSFQQLFQTTDGLNWTTVNTTGILSGSLDFMVNFNGNLVAANRSQNQGVSRLVGSTWSSINSGLPNLSIGGLINLNDTLYCLSSGSGVYRFNSANSQWVALNTGLTSNALNVTAITSSGNTIYISTFDGIWRNTNRSSGWQRVALNNNYVQFIKNSSGRIYAFTDRLTISYDNGQTWDTKPLESTGFLFIGDLFTAGGRIFVTSNNGLFVRNISDFDPLTPVVSSFSPQSGLANASITITGNNFSAVAGNNSVSFGTFPATVTAQSATSITAQVPLASETAGPLRIRVTVNGVTGESAGLFYPQRNVVTTVGQATITLPNISDVDQVPVTSFRMIGVPGRGLAPTDFGFSTSDPSKYVFIRDVAGSYSQIFGSTRTNLGEGVWVLSRVPVVASSFVGAVPLSGTNAIIPVRAGSWNIITNPFTSTVNWSTIQTANGATLNGVVPFGYSAGYSSVTALNPYVGLYVNVPAGISQIIIPQPTVLSTLAVQSTSNQSEHLPDNHGISYLPEKMDWHLSLELNSKHSQDKENIIGISPEAENGYDRFDLPEPPIFMEMSSLYFPHQEWSGTEKKYSRDIRSSLQEKAYWPFEVRVGERGWHQISVQGMETLPEDLDARIVDLQSGMVHSLRKKASFGFAGVQDTMRFVLHIGTREDLDAKVQSRVPSDYALSQNFPNPFNPNTVISYQLPTAGVVSLKVYDVLGREVATLVNETKDAGRYQVNFNAAGLASGVYFYRLQSGNFVQTKKMMVVK